MNGIVQVKLAGGFGNQLHQYAACRKYAQLVGARLEVPEWHGKRIFGLTEPEWSCELPEVNDGGNGLPPALEWGQTNVRIGGYFQFQRWVKSFSRSELQMWFMVKPEWLSLIPRATSSPWYAAAHIRRGDYCDSPIYCEVSKASYLRACVAHNIPVASVHWIGLDSPRIIEGIPSEFSFLPDFVALMQANVILRANSTFSWWAAAMSNARVLAPIVGDLCGKQDVSFVEGNWPRCAHTDRTGVQITDLVVGE